ncbi:DUF2298 domain-containing protein [Chitiniphilus purpureus]|uniref:DUF2298 domain-containing protein n=1 Tax=Chitiniphilus purpureus TaxID=2981137 RepID=A0ABY6DNC7_9NEIS|nr:DUF2298 domain-containing protein [Chitiniphilus sp. CD1]UXY15708.1 DUF2298 domain-containing protein [Chitiniphilus sp. CD1]
MQSIFLLGSLLLLWLHLAGASLIAGRWLPYPLARACSVLLVALLFCATEHFVGLGRLSWLWPISTAGMLFVLYLFRAETRTVAFRHAERVFIICFAAAFAWKFVFPNIYPNMGERAADLYFMLNYYPGERLPPLDIWYPPFRFDFYYAFMHYGAALLGRLFGWQPGFAYNVAFGLMMGLSLTLVWYFASRFITQRYGRWLLAAAIALGGTGITPLIHFAVGQPANHPNEWAATEYMWGSARFIGNFDTKVNTDFGRALFPLMRPENKPTPDFEPHDLPMENFGYQFFLGDYHPPVGGFFLLFLALGLLAWLETPAAEGEVVRRRLAQGLFALTVPVMLITNTWIFPFSVMLLLSWAAWRQWRGDPPDWRAVIGGGLLGALLVYPYLSGLAAQAIQTPIKLVPMLAHTPPLRFVIFFWPLLVLMALALVERRTRPLAVCFVLAFGAMLVLSELVYVDDPSGGKYDRTNTTMKWWGWLYSGGVLACGAIALASARRWVRMAAAASLLLICSYAFDVARYWWYTPKSDAGKLDGAAWFVREPVNRDLVKYLRSAPRGIVLENWLGDAYTNQTLVAMFSQQVSMLGWPNHVSLWHGAPQSVWNESNLIKAFYKGELPDMPNWLARHKVDYIVWMPADNQANPQAFNTINAAIGGYYYWKPFSDNPLAGLWIHREVNKP